MPGDRERQRRAVDGHLELAQEIGQRADVVLVPVGEDHRPEALPVLAEIGEVRDDVVDAGHLVVREQEAAVHGDDVVARLDQHHVEADLAQAPQRDQADGGLGGDVDRNGLGSIKGAHGGGVIVPSRLAATKKRPSSRGPRRGGRIRRATASRRGAPRRWPRPRTGHARAPRTAQGPRPGHWPGSFCAGRTRPG